MLSRGGAMTQLREASWSCHQRLERRLDVKVRFAQREAYRAHLESMWGFCAALEQRLDQARLGEALSDYALRRKLPLLSRDLMTLGVACEIIERLPRCARLPACTDISGAFGCAYVLEGASVGGRTLLPLVQERLGLTALQGASFLAGYGEATAAKWRAFGDALDAWCASATRATAAASAAVATFEALEGWLCGDAP
jgi:heme oxygenase